jgi:glycosyltransferase involved in cell wall biosynthesis
MQPPTVSFIVPCYKLAHLLPECVNSILSQTYRDFEVLILDDCSPDNTAEVARSFRDPRVKHIRNEPNLGHLRNYNKGISLARGRYIWLISADDYLRRPYVLERYVALLDEHPNVGYTFCAGVGVRNGQETGVLNYSVYQGRDGIVPGRVLLRKLLRANIVLAASGLVRRECYEELSVFPPNMPWAGDWYLWCLFALYHDVGFFAEPMVCYREHSLSMTSELMQARAEACSEEEVAVLWTLKQKADAAGLRQASRTCLKSVAQNYARRIARKEPGSGHPVPGFEQFEKSLCEHLHNGTEREWVRARLYAGIGNQYRLLGQPRLAAEYYDRALMSDFLMPAVIVKRFLLGCGGACLYVLNHLKLIAT